MTRPRRFIAELHRRSVWQVIAIYAGGSWLVIEVIDHLIERLGLPEWSYGAAWVLLLLGLPMVVATAFVQEGTPAGEGAGGAGSEAGSRSRTGSGGDAPGGAPTAADGPSPFEGGFLGLFTWRNAILGGVGGAALWGVVATVWILSEPADGRARDVSAEMSLAALPFTNMSADDEDLYFTDGVHEEILAQLARIRALRVISRTSVMGYRESERRLGDIADELDVRYVLEGSVRRFQDRVRITAQLIDAETDAHLWADTYDRPREDLFAIQSEVAREIASALRAELTPEEREEIARHPTDDPEAYDLYLRANDALHRGTTPENVTAAVGFYERALERDPTFVQAASRLARAHLLARWLGYDRSAARLERAEGLVARLESLAPEAPATHYAKGYLHYYGYADFAAALPEMEAALEGGAVGAQSAYAFVLRRLGRWREHIEALQVARRQDPLDSSIPRSLLESYTTLRRYADARQAGARALELAPQDGRIYGALVMTALADGDLAEAERVLAAVPDFHSNPEEVLAARVDVARTARRYDEGLRHLRESELRLVREQFRMAPVALHEGRFHQLSGREDAARESYGSAVAQLEPVREARPWDPAPVVGLAMAYAGLGDAAMARAAMEEARAAYPVDADSEGGPVFRLFFARAHAWLGEEEAALDLIEQLLASPALLSVEWLRLDPDWDGLRDHPRYRALVGEGE